MLGFTQQARAAEIQIRSRCVPHGPIVTLGDIAEVSAVDSQEAERLAAKELFPAPAVGQQRTLRVREIQDMLFERGITMAGNRLGGSSQVVVGAPADQDRSADRRPVSAAAAKRAERVAAESIAQYLQEQGPTGGEWRVAVKLTDAQARTIPPDARKVTVRGGQSPWTGKQQFELIVDDSVQPASLVVAADVTQPLSVVVAAKPIGRGDTIRPSDVRLQSAPAGADRAEVFHAAEDVVGGEAVQEIPTGAVLQRAFVRSPLLVRRGEVVTVYSRAAGIRIRVTARAKEDGSLGDLVSVESLTDRKLYSARVCGIQEAEVYARATQAASAPADDAAPRSTTAFSRSRGTSFAKREGPASREAGSRLQSGREPSRRGETVPASAISPDLAQRDERNVK
jgi:flagella basal body P-ring formation protein FlgA